MYYDPRSDGILPHIIVIGLLLLGACFLCGCEDDAEEELDLSQLPDGSIVVDGAANDSTLDTIGGTVVVEGNISNVRINTAPAQQEED